jgi:hypothetical protein
MVDQHDISILVLEDNLYAVSALLGQLANLEQELVAQGRDLTVVVYPSTMYVEGDVNAHAPEDFDVIILDRDDKLGGSFHALDIEKFGADKVIAISTIVEWNELLKKRGVKRIVRKDFLDLDTWAVEVVRHVIDITK